VNFEFDETQEQLRASVRRYLAERAPLAGYGRAHYGRDPGTDSVWRGFADLGVVGLLAPDGAGGSDAGMVDVAVVLEECGRAAYAGPMLASGVGAVSLARLASAPDPIDAMLQPIVSGEVIATVACFEPGRRDAWRAPSTRVTTDAHGTTVTGTKCHVIAASVAGRVFVTASDERGDLALVAVDVTDVPTTVHVVDDESVDGSRPTASITFTESPAVRLDGTAIEHAIATTLDRLRVALALDALGAAEHALALALDYARERVAFDRPIGSFQAVQHLCADMLRTVELTRAAAYYAAWALDHADDATAHRAATQAAAYAAAELPALGGSAIQVFGGIGFTWEHDIHVFYKRLLGAGSLLGSADDHLAELADLVLDADPGSDVGEVPISR
jgi:acyl-CoA dehydrogenase